MPGKIFFRSFKGKLTLLVGVAVLIPLLLSSLIFGRQLNQQLRSVFASQLTANLATFTLVLQSTEDNLVKGLTRTAGDNTLQVTLDLRILPQLKRYLKRQRELLGVSFLAVYDTDHRPLVFASLDERDDAAGPAVGGVPGGQQGDNCFSSRQTLELVECQTDIYLAASLPIERDVETAWRGDASGSGRVLFGYVVGGIQLTAPAFLAYLESQHIAHPLIWVNEKLVLSNLPTGGDLRLPPRMADGSVHEYRADQTAYLGVARALPIGARTLVYGSLTPLDSLQHAFTEVIMALTGLGILLFLGTIGALSFLISRMSQPIRQLQVGAAQIGAGALTHRIVIQSGDELEALANQFNDMASRLQESYAGLEEQVELRTRELRVALEQNARLFQEVEEQRRQLEAANLRMRAELDFVGQMQQLVLPSPAELAAIDGLDIAAFMEPADEVGGDYYDVLHNDGVVTIGIGDVTGHGLESGMLMVMTQAAVRTLQTIRESDPVRFLDALNRTLYHNVQRMRSDKNLTLVLLTYAQGQVRISGQHEEALIVRHGGTIERIDTLDLGFPLGLEADIADSIRHVSVALQPGDGVVLFTDGITEAADMHHRLYGIDRLCTVISQHWAGTAQDIQAAVLADVRSHIGAQKVYDDITLVVAKQR